MNLSKRVERLEGGKAMEPLKPFLWHHGQPLADALANAGRSLNDVGLMAIRLVGVAPGGGPLHDPVYEVDRRLLG